MPPQPAHDAPPLHAVKCTGINPGAIGIVQVCGQSHAIDTLLQDFAGRSVALPPGRMQLMRLRDDRSDIDDALVARLSSECLQLMPHGGPRVMQRLLALLQQHNIAVTEPQQVDPKALFPEAMDEIEALMLYTLARAESSLAIDLLLDQPRRWRMVLHDSSHELDAGAEQRSLRLRRLIDPPIVVLAGPPNVGKSTLSNALLGRSMSITIDMPGTTRDYVAGRIDLSGLVVTWLDTPGLRSTDDPIEAEAIALAEQLMTQADLLIAMTDATSDWPRLPRSPDLRIANKADIATRQDADVNLSASTGEGLDTLVRTVRDMLVPPNDLHHPGPWIFDDRLLNLTVHE